MQLPPRGGTWVGSTCEMLKSMSKLYLNFATKLYIHNYNTQVLPGEWLHISVFFHNLFSVLVQLDVKLITFLTVMLLFSSSFFTFFFSFSFPHLWSTENLSPRVNLEIFATLWDFENLSPRKFSHLWGTENLSPRVDLEIFAALGDFEIQSPRVDLEIFAPLEH
ncbi:uncharacterized protein V1477_016282 [Vespula maculifrons]|uniref:Uncharacterized protein n=1 Tax=Vespula maculifrons TaxID=7453 RepID=A0ABD2BCK1_VESMC